MIKHQWIAALTMAVLGVGQVRLSARTERLWSYDQLRDASDVVAILKPLKIENNTQTGVAEGLSPKDYQGVTTTFEVQCYLKGGPATDTIRVNHFKYAQPGWAATNGPGLVSFQIGRRVYRQVPDQDNKVVGDHRFLQETPCWLAFLRKMPDGSFAPVSGQYTARSSFRELLDPFLIGR
jgi:hypothetical protein